MSDDANAEAVDERFSVKIKRNDDGTITGGYGKYEHFAVLLAEGFELNDAWEGAGYKLTDGSKQMRKRVMASDLFQARLANLKAQKAELGVLMTTREVSPQHETFKEVRWMALQTWRRALAADNVKIMAEMTNLLSRQGAPAPVAPAAPASDAPAPAEEAARGPGRPAAEIPDERAALLRRQLSERGLNAPALPVQAEA